VNLSRAYANCILLESGSNAFVGPAMPLDAVPKALFAAPLYEDLGLSTMSLRLGN
jgi:hypothetical protein